MASFSHVITLTVEEVEAALLECAFQKAKLRGLATEAHAFHAKGEVAVTGTKEPPNATGATIAWKDE